MAQLRFTITFRGGKADKHWVPVELLAKVFDGISSDLENVYKVVSADDVDVSIEQIRHDSKLYLAAEPKASSQTLSFVSEPADNETIEKVGHYWVKGLRIVGAGVSELPPGITTSVLRNAKLYASPPNGEYEEMELSIQEEDGSTDSVRFDDRLRVEVESQLLRLTKPPDTEILGYEVDGIMHALDDQDYTNPNARLSIKVSAVDGDWVCSVERGWLPMDLNEVWKKRVVVTGRAIFRPRKKTLIADKMEILGEPEDLRSAVDNFIKVNQGTWEGQNSDEYMKEIRDAHE